MASANWNWADWGEFAPAVTFMVFIMWLLDWCPGRKLAAQKAALLGEEQIGLQALKPLLSKEPTDGAGIMSVQLGMSPWHRTPSLNGSELRTARLGDAWSCHGQNMLIRYSLHWNLYHFCGH